MTVEPWISVSSTRDVGVADGLDDGARFQPVFLDGFERGARFAVWWLPANTSARGTVLCVPSPADEALATRRAISAQAWRLARSGWIVLVPDLYGCGDSAGDGDEATLAIWRRDLLRYALLARQRAPGPAVLWSVAAGSLLAVDLAFALDQLLDAIVLWQPCADGDAAADSLAGVARYSPQLLEALSGLPMQPPPIAEGGRQPVIGFLEVGPAKSPKRERECECERERERKCKRDATEPATEPVGSADTADTPGRIAATTRKLLKAWLDAGHLVTAQTVPLVSRPPEADGATAGTQAFAGTALPEALFDATVEFLDPLR